jgi:uncharacterized protein (DUF885 family)
MVWAQIVGEGHAKLFALMYPLVQACERLADATKGQMVVINAVLHGELSETQREALNQEFFAIVHNDLRPAQQAIMEMIAAMREAKIPEKVASERGRVTDVPEGNAVPKLS